MTGNSEARDDWRAYAKSNELDEVVKLEQRISQLDRERRQAAAERRVIVGRCVKRRHAKAQGVPA